MLNVPGEPVRSNEVKVKWLVSRVNDERNAARDEVETELSVVVRSRRDLMRGRNLENPFSRAQ